MLRRRLLIALIVLVCLSSCEKLGSRKSGSIEFLLDWKAGMEYVGFFVAKEKGFYKDSGLDVSIQDGSGATVSAKLIANGTYQLGLSTGDALVIGREQALPVTSLAVLFQRSPVVLFSLEEKGIRKPEDLVGRTIGVSTGDTKYNYYQGLVQHLGLDRSKIREVAVGFDVAPLLSGQVDALLGYVNVQPVQVELQNRPVTVIPLSDYGFDIYSEVIVANDKFILENPDLAQRFVTASLRGWNYAVQNPEEAVDIFLRTHPEQNRKFLARSFRGVLPLLQPRDGSSIGNQTYEGWKRTRDALFKVGLVKRNIDVRTIYTDRFLKSVE